MSAHVIDSRLFKDQFSSAAMRKIFSDETTVQRWLDVEAALARVEARLGIIPAEAAAAINAHARVELFDLDQLKSEMDRTSHHVVPLLRAIRKLCPGSAGEYVHWGATTQDVMDTGTVLQLRDALDEIGCALRTLLRTLADCADRYRDTPMVGRTHGQQALPITFGYKVAVWAAEVGRHLERLDAMRQRVLVGEFSGAVGTLAALGADAEAVQRALMDELGLPCAEISWHTARDGIAEFTSVIAMSVCTAGKIAQEIYTLQKVEFGELEEPFEHGKVGSSTMPHKRNPAACETIVALARVVRSIVPLSLEGIVAEHERDKTALQTEREFVPRLCCVADAALRKTAAVVEGMSVREANMKRNLWLQNGLLMSEPVMLALGRKLGRQQAHERVYEICMSAWDDNEPFRDALLKDPVVSAELSADEIDRLLDPAGYVGLAPVFVDRVVAHARQRLAGAESTLAAHHDA